MFRVLQFAGVPFRVLFLCFREFRNLCADWYPLIQYYVENICKCFVRITSELGDICHWFCVHQTICVESKIIEFFQFRTVDCHTDIRFDICVCMCRHHTRSSGTARSRNRSFVESQSWARNITSEFQIASLPCRSGLHQRPSFGEKSNWNRWSEACAQGEWTQYFSLNAIILYYYYYCVSYVIVCRCCIRKTNHITATVSYWRITQKKRIIRSACMNTVEPKPIKIIARQNRPVW